MSIEKSLREMVQQELKARLGPIQKDIARVSESLEVLTRLREVLERLAPLAEHMGGAAGRRARPRQEALPGLFEQAPARPAPARTAPARAAAARSAEVRPVEPLQPPPPPPELEEYMEEEFERPGRAVRQCAVIGCRRPARSKGYCSAHYQKLRLMVKTNRRPASWVDDASPNSVPDIVLPRGRAAQRDREEEVPAESPPPPAEPPKPKVWIRKKGASERISLV